MLMGLVTGMIENQHPVMPSYLMVVLFHGKVRNKRVQPFQRWKLSLWLVRLQCKKLFG